MKIIKTSDEHFNGLNVIICNNIQQLNYFLFTKNVKYYFSYDKTIFEIYLAFFTYIVININQSNFMNRKMHLKIESIIKGSFVDIELS